MYYVAVMDCDDDLHLLLGDNRHGRIEVQTHISDGYTEFSYERSGMLTMDVILLAVYIGIFVLSVTDWLKY